MTLPLKLQEKFVQFLLKIISKLAPTVGIVHNVTLDLSFMYSKAILIDTRNDDGPKNGVIQSAPGHMLLFSGVIKNRFGTPSFEKFIVNADKSFIPTEIK